MGELAKRFEVHPVMISKWKQEFIEHGAEVFEKKKESGNGIDVDKLYSKIGEHYLDHPTEGVLRVQDFLFTLGFVVNHKRVRRLFRLMGLMAIYPKRNLSKPGGKPIQLLPFFNFSDADKTDMLTIYKMHSFSSHRNVLKNLLEINVHLNFETSATRLISFLKSIPEGPTFNIIGNIEEVTNYNEILSYFDQHLSPKNIICSYKHLVALQPDFNNNFSYRVSIDFPVDEQQLNRSRMILLSQDLPVEYVFEVSSFEDCQKVELLVEAFQIEKYRLNPVYTGENMQFFEENVFLSKEDILSTPMTIKDFFARQALNLYDFGKINILPTGDVYANLNHPVLGNIYTENIYGIIQKEIDNGKSWFNIRNHAPCSNCVYQWFCPSPSDYEIIIGRPDLCHIKNN